MFNQNNSIKIAHAAIETSNDTAGGQRISISDISDLMNEIKFEYILRFH